MEFINWTKPDLTQAISNQVNDIKFQINSSQPSSDLIFVDIDHLSVKKFGRWPWPRDKFAELLEHLGQSRVVALDIVFSEPTSDDNDLADAMEAVPLVQGVIVNNQLKQLTPINEEQQSILLDSALHELNINLIHANTLDFAVLPLLEAATLNGSISTFSYSDGLFRQYPLGFEVNGSYLPALSLQVYTYIGKYQSNIS